jgi:anaerobic magnesium-protoporphyrin IX monomethyl ester cyclase
LKFSLVNAGPYEGLDKREARKATTSFPPLGILYLASVLKERGVEVSVLDQPAKGFTTDETVDWLRKEDPDIVGFSTFSSSGRTAASICQKLKEKNQNIVTVLGNHYATFNSERILRKYPSVDMTVRGEGEETVTELVNCLANKSRLKEVQGISFRHNENIVSTPDRPLIRDLDSLPIPNRKLLDVEYHSMIAGVNVAPKKFTSIVSSRGCVYRCRFCSCTQFARSMWRPRSVANVLDELHLLASDGYKQFVFVDDCFTLNPKRVTQLCRSMRKEKIGMEWICEGRVDNCSYEMLHEIVKAGCRVLYLGIESANQRVLDYYGKQITPQQSRRAVKIARKAGMDVIVGSFMVGAAEETENEILNTIEFAKQIPIDFPQFNISGVYPGTDLWKEFETKGLINGDDEFWETGIAASEIYPHSVPLRRIKQMIHEAFYDFITRPSFLFKEILRTLQSSYRMQVVINSLSRIRAIKGNIHDIV